MFFVGDSLGIYEVELCADVSLPALPPSAPSSPGVDLASSTNSLSASTSSLGVSTDSLASSQGAGTTAALQVQKIKKFF